MRGARAVVILACAALGACTEGTAVTAVTAAPARADAGNAADGRVDAADARDSDLDPEVGATPTPCGDLDARLAPYTAPEPRASPAPVLRGGALVDGTYARTAVTRFVADGGAADAGADEAPMRVVVRVRGARLEFASLEASGVPNCGAFAIDAADATLTLRLDDGTAAVTVTYDATPRELRTLAVSGADATLAVYTKL